MELLESIGHLFYVVSPNKTTFRTVKEVPHYADAAVPDFTLLFILEICISYFLKQPNVRINEAIACLSQGIIFNFSRILAPGGRFAAYVYVYSNYRLVDLPWDSHITWWIAYFSIDFAYYWVHRAAHEINILWATHQVHHSSEDFNIATNVRQSILQIFSTWILYLPLAFVVSPTMYLVHVQFSYIYQFWIHTELVRSLGPLEYIFNTPSHHRVHHGANRSSIDKNFGGTLIIWDRIFGTFAPETEKIVYGLTEPVNSFNPLEIQFGHCIHMWKAFTRHKDWKHKVSVLFKGPGWSVGKPWHGDPDDIPEKKYPTPKYDPPTPILLKLYLVWHFLILIQGYLNIMGRAYILSTPMLYAVMIYNFYSLICIGKLFDRSELAPWMELSRCVLFFLMNHCFLSYTSLPLSLVHTKWIPEKLVKLTYIASLSFWAIFCSFILRRENTVILNEDKNK